jgi:two-component system, chemotaxis family, CheB/CheR fusion protein
MPSRKTDAKGTSEPTRDGETADELRGLLEFIHHARGFDFSGYKKTTLERRLRRRMDEVGVESYSAYLDYLEANPHEFADLFNTILINVTGFFRDRAAWTYVADEVLPALAQADSQVIRAWCAGCATGEEAYTMAIVLAEVFGESAFRERVKIYATDVDENALNHARHATYSREAVKGVPADLLERYFESTDHGYAFRPELRRSVIFGRNDLVQDAPISRVDLLVSRNVLMYFTAEAQARILERFNFALTERGFLFLGKSEMLTTHSDLFTAHNLKWRVFKRVPRNQLRERLALVGGDIPAGLRGEAERYGELRGGAFALSPTAQILVGRSGFVVDVNERAKELFGCTASDIGRPFQDLAISYRAVDLRSAIEQAYESPGTIKIRRVEWRPSDKERHVLDVEIRTVPGANGQQLGVTIFFHDVTALSALTDEHEDRKRELEAAYEELQSTVEELETTNEELQSTNEELETTNEELQSTNEELETTNEELQSTNEELETMNEELQSTNDELETMNTVQHERSDELDRVNLFLEGILTSLGVGIVVLDSSRRVQVWNGDSTDLWGLRVEEVEGKPFDSLDIGLPVNEIGDMLDDALRSSRAGTRELDAVNRRGRPFVCSLRTLPLMTAQREVTGVLLLMADRDHEDAASLPQL